MPTDTTNQPDRGRRTIQGPLAPRRWEVVRLVLAGTYLFGAVVHFALGIAAPDVYEQFADQALHEGFTELWATFVVPNLWFLQPAVLVFELGLGVALLARGRIVRLGHAAGAIFQVGLILSGPWGIINAGLAVVHGLALRFRYPKAVTTRSPPEEPSQRVA